MCNKKAGQGLVGSSFEYSYTRLSSRLRRSARSGIMTLGKDKTPSLLEPSNLPIFQPSNLPTFPKRQCLETGELTKFFEYFKGFCRFTLSGHFWIRKVSRNRRFDQILWILQGILSFYCFQTLLNSESVYKHGNEQFLWLQKCQETWKQPIPLSTECVKKHGNNQFLWVRNVAINMWNDQILWIRK